MFTVRVRPDGSIEPRDFEALKSEAADDLEGEIRSSVRIELIDRLPVDSESPTGLQICALKLAHRASAIKAELRNVFGFTRGQEIEASAQVSG